MWALLSLLLLLGWSDLYTARTAHTQSLQLPDVTLIVLAHFLPCVWSQANIAQHLDTACAQRESPSLPAHQRTALSRCSPATRSVEPRPSCQCPAAGTPAAALVPSGPCRTLMVHSSRALAG